MSGTDSYPATPDETGNHTEFAEPGSPGSVGSSEASTPLEGPAPESPDESKRVPGLRGVSEFKNMNPSSTPLGLLGMARNPSKPQTSLAGGAGASMDNDVMAKARALHQQRMGMSPTGGSVSSPGGSIPGGAPNGFSGNLRMPQAMQRPGPGPHPKSAPVLPKPSLSERRGNRFGGGMGMKLSDAAGPSPAGTGMRRAGPPGKLSDLKGSNTDVPEPSQASQGSKMDDFKKYIDTDKGWITFDGKATITRDGVNFSNGKTFKISLDEIKIEDELGKGNYGTVYKVKHARPSAPRFGQGLSGSRPQPLQHAYSEPASIRSESTVSARSEKEGTTGITMAMKEIRLELDDAKFTTIVKELMILHECVSPHIIDFYGAFYQEGAVYICIEYMDGGSIDKLYSGGIPENVLKKITYSTIMGLKSLKDDHNIIHRDVKPTNILVNSKGQVKICDFGVSGNLVASIAKTNIGCQSYMAPERISGGGMAPSGNADGTYSVQSDIWSLGLTIIECAMGEYPYPPEVSSTIFSQLSAIVEGDPPDLPEEGYSDLARDFVLGCLNKVPKLRPTYAMLLQHPWIKSLSKPQTITEEDEEGEDADTVAAAVGQLDLTTDAGDEEVAQWVETVLQRKANGDSKDGESRPALHAAPLDGASPLGGPIVASDLVGGST